MIKVTKNSVVHYALIYVFLMYHRTYYFVNYQNYIVLITLFLCGIYLVAHYQTTKFDYFNGNYICILLCSLMVTFIVSSSSLTITNGLGVVARFLIAYVCFNYNKKMFATRLVKMVVILSIISLIATVSVQFIPLFWQSISKQSIMSISDKYGTHKTVTYSNFLFHYVAGHTILSRNCGMYNEPGLHQIVLTFSMYIVLFRRKCLLIEDNVAIYYLIILSITLLTSQSTTGYIGMVILFAGYLFTPKDNGDVKVRKYIKCGITISIILILANFSSNYFIQSTIIKKFINNSGKFDLSSNTGKSRIIASVADLKMFIENPLGNGTIYYNINWKSYLSEYIVDVASCVGITSSLAIYGFINTILIIWFYIKNIFNNSTHLIEVIVFIALWINTVLAQPSIFFPCFIAISYLSEKNMVLANNKECEVIVQYAKRTC